MADEPGTTVHASGHPDHRRLGRHRRRRWRGSWPAADAHRPWCSRPAGAIGSTGWPTSCGPSTPSSAWPRSPPTWPIPRRPAGSPGRRSARFGGIDVLINNAGLGLPSQFADAEPDQIARQIAVNFTAPLLLTRHCLPSLIERQGDDHQHRLGDHLRGQLGPGGLRRDQGRPGVLERRPAPRADSPTGVRVCLVEPGPIKTEFMDAIGSMVPAGGRTDPILDNAAPWMTADVKEVARRVARLLDHPRRRLSVLRRLVWPFRVLGAVASLCPPLGDRVVVTLSRRPLSSPNDRGGRLMSLARTRDFLELIKFSHTLFALPFALLGAALAAFYPGAPPPRLAGLAGHPALHGRGALGRDGLQPPGRSLLRRPQSPHRRPAPARRPAERPLGRVVHGGRRRGLRRLDAPVPAQPMAALPLGARPALAPGLFLRQAVHHPGPLLAGALAQPGADRRLDRPPRRHRLAARSSWPRPCCFWVAGFDIIYACQDVDFDQQAGLRSIPRRLGYPQRAAGRRRLPRPDDRPPDRPRPHLSARDRLLRSAWPPWPCS